MPGPSKAWSRGRGYARKELKYAMHSKKRRRNFLLPVKINACDEPRDLRAAYVHHASLYGPGREAELNTLIYRLARELR